MTSRMWVAIVLAACGHDPGAKPDAAPMGDAPDASTTAVPTDHSSTIAIDGTTVYVVNPDADSISMVDTVAGTSQEKQLAPQAVVDGSGNFTPTVMPRALFLAGSHLYVTGQRSGKLYDVSLTSGMTTSVDACKEPVGVLADDTSVYVACTADFAIVKFDRATLAPSGSTSLSAQPWGLSWTHDGSLVVTLFYGGAVPLRPTDWASSPWSIPAIANRGDARIAHGEPRGFYDAIARPHSSETWLVHQLLGTDTAQPDLDFERTAFPAITIVENDQLDQVGTATTLSTDAQDVPGIDGTIGDVVSGPRAIAFTSDGSLALIVDENSEDVLAMTAGRVEATLLRPLPGHMPEGIAISADDQFAYIDERNSHDIAVVKISATQLTVDHVIPRLANDPMPADMRAGQRLFYSANSDQLPITKNHWVACASCHMEGRSDQVTWQFAQGPRDTPSNAGGMLGTGFLFRTADRRVVQDYWHTINVEQGGAFDPTANATQLAQLEAYVDHAIPLPIPPTTDTAKVARGGQVFVTAGCATCHTGPRFTDSGAGNATLDLGGTVVLHDVGTCNAADVAHQDNEGHPRAACMFDTPSLNGIASSPPYFHDGRAATLHDALEMTRGTMGDITTLSADDEAALIEYLRSL
ncbi:MAG: di-heme oxidoredictase family protein [Kofleriaceae bacterium]